jgi:hypothetical protein
VGGGSCFSFPIFIVVGGEGGGLGVCLVLIYFVLFFSSFRVVLAFWVFFHFGFSVPARRVMSEYWTDSALCMSVVSLRFSFFFFQSLLLVFVFLDSSFFWVSYLFLFRVSVV